MTAMLYETEIRNIKRVLLAVSRCDPPKISNGKVQGAREHYEEDETVQFTCERGFEQELAKSGRCLPDGTWSDIPVCRGKSIS